MTSATLPATDDGPLTTDLPDSSLITQHSSLPATDHGQLTTDTPDSSLRTTDHGPRTTDNYWLFSKSVDLSVFLGSALTALAALWIGSRAGVLYGDTPDWAWVPAVLLVDVAHVYATGFRVYLDGDELRRRRWLYSIVPIVGLAAGIALYSRGELVFWRVLAYLAVFHFIRQQYGWVALYRARLGERDRIGRLIDTAAIYAATLYPLIYWHTHLPRRFWWFLAGDFSALPSILYRVAEPVYWVLLAAYCCKSLHQWLVKRRPNPGKDIIVVTTAVCWYVGIVGFNSDYGFTVTNVITHGVPYLALVYWYARSRRNNSGGIYKVLARGPVMFLATLWLFAYLEEMLWDRGVWHDRPWLFGTSWELGWLKVLVVPLLALPQVVHYVLDGFVWRRKNNPNFSLVQKRQTA
jgi:hypothetical protein